MTVSNSYPFGYAPYPEISKSKAFMSNFENVYLFFKEAQYFESLYRVTNGATLVGDSLKSKLSDATGICQLNFLVNKAFSTYQIVSDGISNPSKLDRQKLMQSSLGLISVAIKVVQYAQKAFSVLVLKSYGTGLNIARDCADIGDKSIAMLKSFEKIRVINKKIGSLSQNPHPEQNGAVHFSKLESDALQAELNLEWAGVAQTASILSLAALDLVAQVYMQVTGADKIMLVATSVITLTGHVMSYEASVASQIRAPMRGLSSVELANLK